MTCFIDIRGVQWIAYQVFRFPNVSEEALMEGYLSQPVEPYEIPYRSLPLKLQHRLSEQRQILSLSSPDSR